MLISCEAYLLMQLKEIQILVLILSTFICPQSYAIFGDYISAKINVCWNQFLDVITSVYKKYTNSHSLAKIKPEGTNSFVC